VRVTRRQGRDVEVASSIIAASVTAPEESTCSARSAARTNDVDADQRRPKIGNEEGTGDTSTLNPTPRGPPKDPSRNGYTPATRRYNPNPIPRNENLSTISSGHPHSCLKTHIFSRELLTVGSRRADRTSPWLPRS
jgi:hypothetical protein